MSSLQSKDGSWHRPDSRVWWHLPYVMGAVSGEGRSPTPPTPGPRHWPQAAAPVPPRAQKS